jgi:hypothetical protein
MKSLAKKSGSLAVVTNLATFANARQEAVPRTAIAAVMERVL